MNAWGGWRIDATKIAATVMIAATVVFASGVGAKASVDEEGSNPTRQECISRELNAVEKLHADMYSPGKLSQRTDVTTWLTDRTACDGITAFNGNARVKMQDGLHPSRIHTIQRYVERLFQATSNEPGSGVGFSLAVIHGEPRQTYYCRPGPKVTKAWVEARQRALDPNTHKVLAQKILKVPIAIHRNHGKGC